ncbi:MAG: phosphate signaling complex protein PhoU [Pseudomonadota bacterium]
MATINEHIVKSFDDQLNRINDLVVRMGGLAEAQVAGALDAMVKRDCELAARVIEGDDQIDDLEHELEQVSVLLLALRQPMANDLRRVVAALKISSDLERIGDYAANAAKRVIALEATERHRSASSLSRMAQQVRVLLRDALDAYVTSDAERALEVWRRDVKIDELYGSLFEELLEQMKADPGDIAACTHLLFIAKNIERIGDHATNIAESVHYLVTGRYMEGARPRGVDPNMPAAAEA